MLRRLLNLAQNQGAFDPPLCMSLETWRDASSTANRFTKREPSELPFSYWELPSREDKAPKKGDWRSTTSVQSPHNTTVLYLSPERVACVLLSCKVPGDSVSGHFTSSRFTEFTIPLKITIPPPRQIFRPPTKRGIQAYECPVTSWSSPWVSVSMHMINF